MNPEPDQRSGPGKMVNPGLDQGFGSGWFGFGPRFRTGPWQAYKRAKFLAPVLWISRDHATQAGDNDITVVLVLGETSVISPGNKITSPRDAHRYSSFPTRVPCVSGEETHRRGCFAMAYFGPYTRIPQRPHLDRLD